MDENLVCVKYVSALGEAAKKTFKRMQRVKFTCFTVSRNFLAFGASSGGVYVFQRECSKFLKFIPNKDSSITAVSISSNERHLGLATSKGLIVIVENFLNDSDSQTKVYHEHAGVQIVCFNWQENDFYVGDSLGRVSVITVGIDLLPKTIFQLPLTTILHLDSSIVQMDLYRNYLLVSTTTKTYICNTQREFYKPIGKKLRDGFYGACFYGPKVDDKNYSIKEASTYNKKGGVYRTLYEAELQEEIDINNQCVIFCARPGIRLWQANFDGSVEVTYQFKDSMQQIPNDLLIIRQDPGARLEVVSFGDSNRLVDKNNFNFGKIFPICERLILTYSFNGLFVFDLETSRLRFWIKFNCDIRQIEICESIIFVWTSDLDINLISLVNLEELILRCLYKKQYYLCADICLHFQDNVLNLLKVSNKLYLLSALKEKISEDALLKLLGSVFSSIEEINKNLNSNEIEIKAIDDDWETLSRNDFVKLEEPPAIGGTSFSENSSNENKEIELLAKQFRLHKTHKNIDIPDFRELIKHSNLEKIVAMFQQLIELNINESPEDITLWCQELILKEITLRNSVISILNPNCLNFVRDAFLSINQHISQEFCICGFPSPNCHKFEPKYNQIGINLLNTPNQKDLILKNVPYYIKHEFNEMELNLPLIVQFCDKELFINNFKKFSYDVWDQTMQLFVKLFEGRCLNCDRDISLKGCLSWTDIAMLILQNLGAQYTLKLLKRYSNFIPNGSLNHEFYETCIFMASFDCGTNCQDPKVPVSFVEDLDKVSRMKFRKSLTKYLEKKHLGTEASSSVVDSSSTTQIICSHCKLPMKNPILGTMSDRRFILECNHQFHNLCFAKNNRQCNICK